MRAKLQKLADKHSTAAASSINAINKPDYHNPTRPGPGGDLEPKSSTYWKSLHDEVGYYEPISDAVSGNRNETGTKVAALDNATYSETVHDDAVEKSAGDGQQSISGVTEESIVRVKWQDDAASNETGSRNDSAAGASITGENKAEVNPTRKRRFDVASNEIPTFLRGGEPVPGNGYFRPEVENWDVNRLDTTGPANEGGRRISQNERYSKVGRDPPMWVPVEPIDGGPFLREPASKDTTLEEPYEPIPPLAKNDIGVHGGAHRKWKSSGETEPDVTSPVNRTGASVRRRPEAKEGGPPELGKIASPLEREWIQKAEVAAAVADSSPNDTQSTSGVRHKETAGQPIRNQTAQKREGEVSHKSQSDEDRMPVNHDQKGCAATSWKNVQLIQDAMTGGYYVIQAKVRSNCSATKLEKGQKHIRSDQDAVSKSEKDDTTRKTADQEPVQTSGKTLPEEYGEAGWMFFGMDEKLDRGASKHSRDDGTASSSTKDFEKDLASSTETNFEPIPLEAESSSVDDLADDLVRYYVIGKHPRVQTGYDSDTKDDVSSLNGDMTDQEQSDLLSNPGQEDEVSPDIIPSSYRTHDGAFWQPVPLPGQESPWNVDSEDVMEGGFQIVERSELDPQRGTESPNGDGKFPQSTGIAPTSTTAEVEPVVAAAAFHSNTGSRVSSISGQSVTWGKTSCSFSLTN